ncbi:MAG: DUF1553 domain-containing protein [Opitutus sp.]|nr:DUF1553 domain-containing protein [Opitutus sp.]
MAAPLNMSTRRFLFLWSVFCSGVVAEEKVTFNEHIRPILAENCFYCHGQDPNHRKAKRRLDLPEGATAETKGIRAIVPGDLENSELWLRINSDDPDEVMPPEESHKEPLKPEQRALIKRWIEQGAVYQNHWAHEPVARPAVPALSAEPGDNPVDRFVAAKLASRGLTFSPEASREVLLRRVTLDLTGLPPTLEELDAFLADHSTGAYDRAVTRLLASTRYGENFARGWLDAVRYGDTHGLHLDNVRAIWPYRDWVVQAFNENKPFDQFTVDQLAGDLVPGARLDQLVASGYNRLILSTSEGGAIEAEAEARNTADRIDTTSAVWLGLTVGCASCHDHKFDPLTQREYYSMGAFFKGLADHVWDGNIPRPGPLVLITNALQQKRLDVIAAELPARQAALTARADQLSAHHPVPEKSEKKPISYEVVWAEDGDVPTHTNVMLPAPVGEWRSGAGVPLAGGTRALRLEGKVERPLTFATGEVPLKVGVLTRVFVNYYPDAANPPSAVSLEFISDGQTKRLIWGDPKAFNPEVAGPATMAGTLPPAGTYTRLEIDATDGGLATDQAYTGVRIAQSGGAAWWDHIGTVCTSASAADDPLISAEAWVKGNRDDVRAVQNLPVPNEIAYLLGVSNTQQDDEDKKRLATYYRDYVYGPLRGPLEPEAHAARQFLAEQVHYELTLTASLIAKERAVPKPAHVLLRGQYDKPGDRVQPATPAFLPPLQPRGARADRLDLARWLVDPRNPLTARVAVNRFWQQTFGAGLVRTPGDFGAQGDPPTHPELLDWLASEFVSSGWDVKRLVRLMVTSRTYRQDSRVTPALLELDPANKLLARGPRLRLDAEVIRDQALAVSGLLQPAIGGPPVRPYQPTNIWEPVAYAGSNTRVYVQDHGAALYRRSLYTFMKRTAPPPSMSTFDAPSRETICVVRTRTDTPLQALALMNDVQQFEAARGFAERVLTADGNEEQRLTRAFRSVTGRMPTDGERTLLNEALARQRAQFAADPAAAKKVLSNGESKAADTLPVGEFAAWTMVASLLLNLDETLTRN